MAFKIVLIGSISAQLVAAYLSLRINARYRRYSAWLLISASSVLLAVMQLVVLLIIWQAVQQPQVFESFYLWAACLTALMVSVLFLGGVALIEPLFIGAARAESLLKQEKQQLELAVHQKDTELRLAQQIQQRLLPRSPPKLPGFDIAGRCTAAEWTSGDYFDFIQMEDGTLGVVIADVTGHGTGPALLMATTRAFLRASAQASSDIASILTSANRSLSRDLEHGRFVTLFFASIDPKTATLIYTNAGHHGSLLFDDGTVTNLGLEQPPLGVLSEIDFLAGEPIQMKLEEALLLVSDGIPETKSPSEELYGHHRVLECFRENRAKPAEQIVQSLLDSVREFAHDAPQQDDMTAIVVVRR